MQAGGLRAAMWFWSLNSPKHLQQFAGRGFQVETIVVLFNLTTIRIQFSSSCVTVEAAGVREVSGP